MTISFNHETNQVEDEYYGEEEDDLDDFIVYTDDEEDKRVKRQKLHQQQDDEEEDEEFDEDEEAPVGMQEVLSLREHLKDKIRRKNAAMAAGLGKGSSSVKQQTAKDRFGTFFGPSRQSLAPRVIQEGCSSMMKELQNARPKNDASLFSKAQPGVSRSLSKPKTVGVERRKADALRENRDYSSVFADDAESSPSTKEQTGNKPGVLVRVPVNSAGKNRVPNGHSAKSLSNGQGLKGAAPCSHGRVQKAGSPGKLSIAERKGTVAAAARNGPNSAAMNKTTGLQPSLQSKRQQQQPSQGQKLQPPSQNQRPQSNGRHQIRKGASSAQVQRSGQKQLAPISKLKPSRPVEKGAAKRKTDDQFDHAFISKEIGALFGYDRSKYVGTDEDDRNMEADYASILKEERRSAKLARQEDREQLCLIEEEDRRERAKRKIGSSKAREEVSWAETF